MPKSMLNVICFVNKKSFLSPLWRSNFTSGLNFLFTLHKCPVYPGVRFKACPLWKGFTVGLMTSNNLSSVYILGNISYSIITFIFNYDLDMTHMFPSLAAVIQNSLMEFILG